MTTSSPMLSKKRADYQPSSHLIPRVDIQFLLGSAKTKVTNTLQVVKNDAYKTKRHLVLNGKDLVLLHLVLDGRLLVAGEDYNEQGGELHIYCDKTAFTLEICNEINPGANTSLEGLYFSNNAFCTQCEAEGFRKITYFLDRPDVLSVYTVSISTSDTSLTYLLSNGNLTSDNTDETGLRTCVWQDPFPKPCYLFALVAGHFDKLVDTFVTRSNRRVSLELFVDEGRKNQGQHALDSLKKAMRWDEDVYDLEYDLDIYMIVAVDFFNMGAMENKGLNVFNSKFVLANPDTATDTDYFNIESIIAHEYFHNWTGNRVTCRDWFQLSLKEGLTVFRDQQFSADMFSYLSTRIKQVELMRERQFAEDAGPMSHPIRPDEVMEMNNFYTVTVYDKGAEVIRMLHSLLGKTGFAKGMALYFERHDGQAVTCDDFVSAMQDANAHDLSHFKRWYSQSGTPVVTVNTTINTGGETIIEFSQFHPQTSDQSTKHDLYIPVKLECLREDGTAIDLGLHNNIFVLDQAQTALNIGKVDGEITPSLLQDFSAPVKVKYEYTTPQLIHIIANASNDYAKWEAWQRLFLWQVKHLYEKLNAENIDVELAKALTRIEPTVEKYVDSLNSLAVKSEVLAELLSFPSIESAMSAIKNVKPQLALKAYDSLVKVYSSKLLSMCLSLYQSSVTNDAYCYTKEQIDQRAIKSACLTIVCFANHDDAQSIVKYQYENADNMTDKISALQAAKILFEQFSNDCFNHLMQQFEQAYQHDAVVMDKWFSLHATTKRHDILSHLDLLQAHANFSANNPNKVRALIGSFAFFNTSGFHAPCGSGYRYLADYIIKADAINPQLASRLITPLIQFENLDSGLQEKVQRELVRLFGVKQLSKDLFEKISKTLKHIKTD